MQCSFFPWYHIYLGKIWKGNIIFKIFSTGINWLFFYSKARYVFRCSCDTFCISVNTFSIWVSTLLCLCVLLFILKVIDRLWISRKIDRNKCFLHLHFVFNQNIFTSVLEYNWIGRSSPHNFDHFFSSLFCLYSVHHYKIGDSRMLN